MLLEGLEDIQYKYLRDKTAFVVLLDTENNPWLLV